LKRINDVYLSSNSITEVNITQDIVKPIQEAIEKNDITDSTCAKLKTAIKANLSDTMSRFIRTAEFQQFAATVELQHTLRKANNLE
jgi:hypothetical protein